MILFFFAGLAVCRLFRYEFPVSGGEAGIWFHLRFFLPDWKELQFFQAEETTRRVDTLPGKGEFFFLVRCLNYIRRYVIFFYPSVIYPSEPCSGTAKPLLLLKMLNANER